MYIRYKLFVLNVLCFALVSSSQWTWPKEEDENSVNVNFSRHASIKSQRISKQKCEEYKKFTYAERKGINPMTFSSHTYKDYICAFFRSTIVSREHRSFDGDFPHMARIGYESNQNKEYICGGALISDQYVLTAALCNSTRAGLPTNFVTLNSISEQSYEAIHRRIAKFTVHPEYENSIHNDIALIKMDASVKLESGKLRPACLWTENELTNAEAIFAGWGTMVFRNYGHPPKVLLDVTLDLVDVEKCKNTMQNNEAKKEHHICSKGLKQPERIEQCEGDIGGVLQVISPDENPCQHYIISVMSKTTFCDLKNPYAVHVKVAKFIDWIEKIVWNVDNVKTL